MTSSDSAPAAVLAPHARVDDGLQTQATPALGVHIAALDGIRGLAVLLVLYFHYGRSARNFGFSHTLLSISEFGWVGVDLFFVLSGFLITGILYDAKNSAGYFRNFYARRSLRIFPLYYLAFAVVLVFAAIWPSAAIWPTISPLWFVFYLSNVAMVTQAPLDAGVLGHFWSLAIEEHFYLAWPIIVLMATRRRLMSIAAALLVFSLTVRVVWSMSGTAPPGALYLLTPLRLDALAVGAFCSLALRGPDGLRPLVRPAWIAMIGGGAIIVLIVLLARSLRYDTAVMETFGFTSLAVAFGGMLLVSLSFRPANLIFSNPMLRWFGRYSYGLYVWHPIINMMLFYTSLKTALGVDTPLESVLYLLLAFVATIAVALASYHLWEKTFLSYKSRFH